MQTITPFELYEYLQDHQPILLDVREPEEFAICHIENSLLIPMGEISSRIQELDEDDEIICICHHGMRSMQVAMYLQSQGFNKLINLTGGIEAWAANVDPNMQRY